MSILSKKITEPGEPNIRRDLVTVSKVRQTETDKANLTRKQKKFCDAYIEEPNGEKAAIAAGYSPKTATVIASQNLIKLNIRTYIAERQLQIQDESKDARDKIISQLCKIGLKEYSQEDITIAHSLKAIELMIRMCGFDVQEQTSKQGSELVVRIIKPTTGELRNG